MSKKLVVGLPPSFSGDGQIIDEYNLTKRNMLYLIILPKDREPILPGNDKAFRIFRLINPKKGSKGVPLPMKIYFSLPTTIQETFTNELTDHFLSQILKTSERMGQVFQTLGVKGKALKNEGKKFADNILLLNQFKKLVPESLQNFVGNMGEAIGAVLQGYRYDFPKMWADSKAELSQEITFKLFCDNPNSDKEFSKKIIVPLINLLKYVVPLSTGGAHYHWPYMCSVESPGLFYLKEACISSLQVNKGMGVNFGINNRPNIVEISMQITNIRNVLVNDTSNSDSGFAYTLSKYERNLRENVTKRPLDIMILKENRSSKKIENRQKSLPSENVTQDQKDRMKSLNDNQFVQT